MTRRFTALITYLNSNTDNKVLTDIPEGKCAFQVDRRGGDRPRA
jgi:hypothetical protein